MAKRVDSPAPGSGVPDKGRPSGAPEQGEKVPQPAPPKNPGVPEDVLDEDEDEDVEGGGDDEGQNAGDSPAFSSCVQIISGDPPAAPSGLVAKAAGPNNINLGWIDNSNNEDGFEIERSLNQVDWFHVGLNPANAVVFFDSGLQPDTTYYYRVRAYNIYGKSDYTDIASATTEEGDGLVEQPWDPDDPFKEYPDFDEDENPYKPCPTGSKCISPLFPNLKVEYVDADDGTPGCMERFYDTKSGFEVVYNCDMNVDINDNDVTRSYNGVTIPAHTGHIFQDDITQPGQIAMFPRWADLEAFFQPRSPDGVKYKIPFLPLESYCGAQPKEPRGSSAKGRQYFVYPPFRHLYWWKKGSSQVTQQMADEAFQYMHDWVKVEVENRPWGHISDASTPPTVSASSYKLNTGTFREWSKSKDSDDGWGAWEESGMEHLPQANFAALGSRLGMVSLWQTWKWVIQAVLPGNPGDKFWTKKTRSMSYTTKLCMSAYWAGFDLSDPNLINDHVGAYTPRAIMGRILSDLNLPLSANRGIRAVFEGPENDWGKSSSPSLDFDSNSDCGNCATDDWQDSQGRSYGHQLEQKNTGQAADIMFALAQVWWHHKWSESLIVRDDHLLSSEDLTVLESLKDYLAAFMKKAGWFWDSPYRGQFSRWAGRVDVDSAAVVYFPDEATAWEAIDWTDATCVSGVSQGCDYNAGRGRYRPRRIPSDLDTGVGTVGWRTHRFEGVDAWRFSYSAMAISMFQDPGDPGALPFTCVENGIEYWVKWGLKGGFNTTNWKDYGDQFMVSIYAMYEYYGTIYDEPGDEPDPPNPPSNYTANGVTVEKIKTNWKHDGIEVDTFEIQQKLSSEPDSSFTTVKTIQKPAKRYWRGKGLLEDTSYDFRIRAQNQYGDSAWSNVATATTKSNADPPIDPEDDLEWKEKYNPGDSYRQCPTGSGCISPLWPTLKYEYVDAEDGTAGVMERFYDTDRDFEVVFNADTVPRSWKGRVICPHRGFVFKDDQKGDADLFSPPEEYYQYEDFWFPGPTYPFVQGDWRNNKADVSPGGDSRRYQVYPPFRFVSEYRKGNTRVTKPTADRYAAAMDVWMRVECELRPWSHISAPFTPPVVKLNELNPDDPVRRWTNETKTDGSCGTAGWNCWDYGHNETGAQSAYAGIGHRLGAIMLWMNYRWLVQAIEPGNDRDGWRNQPRSMHHAALIFERAYWAGFDYADPDMLNLHCGGWAPKTAIRNTIKEIDSPRGTAGIREKLESYKTPSGNVTINFNAECGACATDDFEDSLGRRWGLQMQAQFWWQASFLAAGMGRVWHADQLSTVTRPGDEELDEESRAHLASVIDYLDMVSKKYAFWWDGQTTLNGATADRGRFPYTFGRHGDTSPAGGVFPDRVVTDDMIDFIWRECGNPPGTEGCSEPGQTTRAQYLSHRIPVNWDDPDSTETEGWNLYKGNTSDNRWFFPYTAGAWMRPPDTADESTLDFTCFENGDHYIAKHGFRNIRDRKWTDYQHHTMYYYSMLDLYDIPYTLPP